MTHHLHTVFSDGRDQPEAMLEAALAKGWPALGFSDHGPVEGESWCMKESDLDRYLATLASLRRQYAGRIEVYTGLELDWSEHHGLVPDTRLEYWIGSFHFFEENGRRFAIDGNLDMVRETLAVAARGDGRRFAERYYRGLTEMVRTACPPVLGHLDLLKKQNAQLGLFDPGDTWYRSLVSVTLDAIAETGCIVEVNTGGMARSGHNEPYPSWEILAEVRERGIPIQLNSDTHQADTIDFAYGPVREGLKALGFDGQRVFSAGKWVDRSW